MPAPTADEPPTPPTDEPLRTLGRALRRLRRERDLSQEAVAAAAGVHPNQVGRLERGDADVHTSTMLRIVAGIGVTLADVARVCEELRGAAAQAAGVSRSGSSRKP